MKVLPLALLATCLSAPARAVSPPPGEGTTTIIIEEGSDDGSGSTGGESKAVEARPDGSVSKDYQREDPDGGSVHDVEHIDPHGNADGERTESRPNGDVKTTDRVRTVDEDGYVIEVEEWEVRDKNGKSVGKGSSRSVTPPPKPGKKDPPPAPAPPAPPAPPPGPPPPAPSRTSARRWRLSLTMTEEARADTRPAAGARYSSQSEKKITVSADMTRDRSCIAPRIFCYRAPLPAVEYKLKGTLDMLQEGLTARHEWNESNTLPSSDVDELSLVIDAKQGTYRLFVRLRRLTYEAMVRQQVQGIPAQSERQPKVVDTVFLDVRERMPSHMVKVKDRRVHDIREYVRIPEEPPVPGPPQAALDALQAYSKLGDPRNADAAALAALTKLAGPGPDLGETSDISYDDTMGMAVAAENIPAFKGGYKGERVIEWSLERLD